jgi:hypothetical protein
LNRVLPKQKIYEYARPSRSVRMRFVDEVEQIVWRYKLAPETLNLPARQGIQEIHVFAIYLKTDDVSETVLRTIDRAISFPLIFELLHGNRVKSVAAFKRPSEAEAGQWVVDSYFGTPWIANDHGRMPLPLSLDMASLYEKLLRLHIVLPARRNESLPALVERANVIRRKESECRKLEARVRQEVQFNRKVELNHELHKLKQVIERLLAREDREDNR